MSRSVSVQTLNVRARSSALSGSCIGRIVVQRGPACDALPQRGRATRPVNVDDHRVPRLQHRRGTRLKVVEGPPCRARGVEVDAVAGRTRERIQAEQTFAFNIGPDAHGTRFLQQLQGDARLA